MTEKFGVRAAVHDCQPVKRTPLFRSHFLHSFNNVIETVLEAADGEMA
jgi:hypothetical protein